MDIIGKQTSKTNSRELNFAEHQSSLFNTDPIPSYIYKDEEKVNSTNYTLIPDKINKLAFWPLVYEELIIGLMLALLLLTF
ncbi:MAG: hypothetical protein IPP71_00610 [Bacteroidetes bacterium]|nr:hypothetical protein [Bacteroidota bacterium]